MTLDLMLSAPGARTEAPQLVEILAWRGRHQAGRQAYCFLKDGEEEVARLTWGEVDRQARGLAAALLAAGAGGERALLLHPPGLAFVTAFLGCLYAGVVAVPSYPPRRKRNDPRLLAIAEDASPTWVLTTAEALSDYRSRCEDIPRLAAARWLATDTLGEDRLEVWEPPPVDPSAPAFLQYTSGSTGTPRGVVVSHANLAENEALIRRAFEQSESSVIVSWLPTYHDMGLIGGVLQPLVAGARCVLMSPGAFLQQPRRWLAAISRYGGTTSGGPNFAFDLCARRIAPEDRRGLDLRRWRVAFNGAEPIRADTLERFSAAFAPCGFERRAFFPCYGLAEATLFVAGGPRPAEPVVLSVRRDELARGEAVPAGAGGPGTRELVGSGLAAQEVRVVDPETAEPCPPGRVGEIWVSGPSVARGYWNRPGDTAALFGARVAGEAGGGPYLRTGDLGFVSGDELFVTGRLKDLVILRGRNHDPADVERTVERACSALQPGASAAFAADLDGEERLVVAGELQRGVPAGIAAIAEAVRRAVAEEHEAQIYELVLLRPGTLPRTTSGKVQRGRCRDLYLAGELAVVDRSRLAGVEAKAAPETVEALDAGSLLRMAPAERQAALIDRMRGWLAELARLDPAELEAERPLTALGLDSLSAAELSHEVETRLGATLSPGELLRGASLATLAREIDRQIGERGAAEETGARPAPAGGRESLSPGQRALWFVDRLAPEQAAYNLAGAARASGDLDAAAIERAVRRLHERHAALRTAFEAPEGEPLQTVAPAVEPDFHVVEAAGWTPAELDRALAREAARPFDLGRPPLLRLHVFRRSSSEAVLLLVVHHLVADFWSVGVLLRDLAALYGEETGGPAASLPALGAEYRDFVRTQAEWLARHGDEALAAWKRELAGELPELALPTDRPRPGLQSFRGGSAVALFEPGLAGDLRALARETGTTLFTLLLSAFQNLLHRLSGQDDLLVGTPTAGRATAALRPLVGYFVNPVVVRGDLGGDPSWRELVERTRQKASAAFDGEPYPFALLSEALQPHRDASRSALIQAMFVLQRSPLPEQPGLAAFALGTEGGSLPFAGLTLSPVAVERRAALFDLTLSMAELPAGLGAALEYASDLFDRSTALRLLRGLEALLRDLARNPEHRISGAPLLAEAERWQLLAEWNDTAPAGEPPALLHELFEAQARRTPEAVALRWPGEVAGEEAELTYRELDLRADRLAARLRSEGAGPEVRVGVALDRRPDLLVALLGVLKAGGAYVPLDPAYPRERLERMLEDSGARVLLIAGGGLAVLGGAGRRTLDLEEEPGALPEAAGPGPRALPGNLAYLIYTSGSTGRPKGVAIEHRSAVALCRWAREVFRPEELSGVLAGTSVCFDLSVFELFVPLSVGGAVILAGNALAFADPRVARDVTLVNTVPSAIRELAQKAGALAGRCVNLAGEPLTHELARQVLAAGAGRVLNLYGPSEDTTYSTFEEVSAAEVPSIGRPIAGTRALVLDRAGHLAPLGVPGDLHLGGEGLARGYLGRPELTAERFVPDPFAGVSGSPPGARLYRTGDLARRRADGRIEFLGRADHQVKIRGHRIELGEIEAVLEQHPAVREAAVAVQERGPAGRVLVAYAVPAEPQVTPQQLRASLLTQLPEPMVPSFFVILPALPHTLTGKLDRRALPAVVAEEPAPAETAGGPRQSPVEELLAQLWQGLLGEAPASGADHFFERGGHSLLAARLVAQIRSGLGVDLPLQAIFQAPTFAGLARLVEERQAAASGTAAGTSGPIPAVPRNIELPLSYGQERLWFLQSLEPESPAYNMPMALALHGPLRAGTLYRALAEVRDRHEALRTRFAEAGGRPVQRIEPAGAPFPLPLVDLGGLPAAAAAVEAGRRMAEGARRPFDLLAGPLFRTVLLRRADGDHTLFLCLHHTIADGESLDVLGQEISTLYAAFLEGGASPLPPVPLQPADLAHWERRRLEEGALAREVAYWRERLADDPGPLELPTDRPRQAARGRSGRELPVRVGPGLTTRLLALGRASGTTPFMTLLALYQALLARWAGARSVSVGFPIANRERPELLGMIGLLANTLVLRTEAGAAASVGALLHQVRERALEAYAHRSLPFEKLVEELAPERSLRHNPLFQVSFALQTPTSGLRLPGLETAAAPLPTGRAKWDLHCVLTSGDGGLAGHLEYDADLFDAPTLIRLWQRFLTLAEAAAAEPEQDPARLPWLGGAEIHQLLFEWNDTEPERAPARVDELLAARCRERPDAVVLVEGDRRLTAAELDRRSTALARRLRALGVGPEVRVAVVRERSIEQVLAIVAVIKAGGAYVPVDPAYPRERQELIFEDSGAALVLGRAASPGAPCPVLDLEAELADAPDGDRLPAADAGPGQLAYMIYTSGSTGRPKGVGVSHGALANLVAWHRRAFHPSASDRMSLFAGPGFDAAVWELWSCLAAGVCLVIPPADVAGAPRRIASWLAAEGITMSFLPTPVAEAVLAEEGLADDALRAMFTGGDRLRRRPDRRFRFPLYNLYGPTENTVISTASEVHAESPAGRPPSIGRPIDDNRALVLDSQGQLAPLGALGELAVGGAGLARGYLGRPDLPAERFVPDPWPATPGARLYRTGDRARLRPDGVLEMLGRADDQVQVRGLRVEPGEVEAVLGRHPAVREALVLPREQGGACVGLIGYVVPAAAGVDVEDLRRFAAERLPGHMVPGAVVVLPAFPLTPNGKVDRRALPRPEAQAEAFTPPSTPAEVVVAQVWSEVLGSERPGREADFFALGGHSLLATQVVSRLSDRLGVDLPVRALFEAPVLSDLAARVEEASGAARQNRLPPLVPVPREDEAPASFAQQRLWFLDQLEPDSPFYNVPLAVRLTGSFSPAAFQGALGEIVRRHEALRTSFRSVAGELRQRVLPPAPVALPIVDLTSLPGGARDRVRPLAEAVARRPMDLAGGELLRVVLLRLAADEHVACVVFHHIASDGWSVGVFVRELSAFYQAALHGSLSPLPELRIQYADFAVWQRGALAGERLAPKLDLWRRQLAGTLALDLPTDRPRPPLPSFAGAQRRFHLPAALGRRLLTTSRRQGVTPFMTLLAGFQAVLSRYSGQSDFAVGSPVANRTHPELEPLLGLFINMVALRADLSGNPTFAELLARTREVALAAYAHQEVPFERIVEELGVERDLSRNPVFQVVLILQTAALPPLTLPGVETEAVAVDTGTSRFDLTLVLTERADGSFSGFFEYDADLFSAATIERLGGHLRVLLDAAVADPSSPVEDLPLVDAALRQQVLREWNDSAAAVSGETIHEAIWRQAAATPERIALTFRGADLTYRELTGRAGSLARRLQRAGVGPDRVVGLHAGRSLEMVVGMLAILRAGGAYLPLDPGYPEERLRWVLEDAGAALVLTDAVETSERLGEGFECLLLGEELPEAQAAPAGSGPDHLAYVIYTSGSTGRPKGVMVTHGNVMNFFTALDRTLGAEPVTLLAVTSISFDISVLELLWTLSRGSRVVLQGDRPAELFAAPPAPAVAARAIDFSLFYFAEDSGGRERGSRDRYRLLIEGARFADRNGFAAVWTPERHFHAFGGLYPNPSVTSAAVAAVTERVGIRAGSVVLPLHHPLRVAEEWSVVDNLSGGRVGVSFATGWHANDFALAPDAFARRRELLTESLATVRRLWRGEAVRVLNGAGQEVEVAIHPPPVQPELPVWLTAAGNPATFELAGTLGAHVLTHLLAQSPEELGEKVQVYRRAWRAAGHDGPGHVTLMVHTFVDPDVERVRAVVREPFLRYLESSLDLLRPVARSMGLDLDSDEFGAEAREAVLAHAFERFFHTSALFGSPESCRGLVDRLKGLGIDEIGCLIDFGCPTEDVLASLPHLDALRRQSRPAEEAPGEAWPVAAQIERYGVTHLQCTPSMARMLAADPPTLAALRSLDTLLLGGEALPASLVAEIRSGATPRIVNLYGPTETTVWSASHRVLEARDPMPIGRPFANTGLHVVDRHLRPLPPLVPGELLIGGDGVTRGYLDRPDLTAERFLPDALGGRPGARLYRTGDRARVRPDGEIEFLGRLDHQVKIRGYRIEPGEIESCLQSHPAVRAAAVTVREDLPGEKTLAAYVVPARRRPEAAAEEGLFVLPNGLAIAHLGAFQTSVGYRELFEDDVYSRHGLEIGPGACVFDVGANVGLFLLYVEQQSPGARIYAFEPVPPTFEKLRQNAAMHAPQARVFNCGLADRPGTERFTFYPQMAGLSGRYADPESDRQTARSILVAGLKERGIEAGSEAVGLAELDRFLADEFQSQSFDCEIRTLSQVIDEEGIETIDLLKVDVERSEVDVLRGVRDEHWPRIRQVVIEIDTPEGLAEISPLLARHGFEVTVDDFITAEGGEGPSVHVYLLYARRPEAVASPRPEAAVPASRALSVPDLKSFVADRLPPHMVPQVFVVLDELPLTPNGKIDRKALPAPRDAQPGPAPARSVPPQLASERALAEVWKEVLQIEQVGLHDNFFELGGTSLLVVQLRTRLREALGHEIELVELFRYPTVAALDAFLASRRKPVEEIPGAARFQSAEDRSARKKRAMEERRRPPRT
ncbi:MAG TPA: amino acid adenylation domain-containing protein [Thermoanaerobaculia bacterium]|nr:amino acid adenylation domain-containing protein [Thermoanaerobaculia bacterium]